MKKITALLLCAAALLVTLAGCGDKLENIVFTGKIEEIHDSSILVITSDDVGFDIATVHFDPDIQISFNILVGQTVKITILPLIAESQPVQVTAVAIELVSAPPSPDLQRPDYTASFFRADSMADGGWDFVISRAANKDTMMISSVRHIPVIVLQDVPSLSDFINAGKVYFQFDVAYDDGNSFSENAQKYDASFFEANTLLIICAEEPSGSIRHKINDAVIKGDTLSVAVETIVPQEGTDDMADWFVVLELSNEDITGVTSFDAQYA